MATKTEGAREDDVLRNYWAAEHNFSCCKIKTAAAVAAGANLVGAPVSITSGVATVLTAAQVTAFTATSVCHLIVDDSPMPALSTTETATKFKVLSKPPATIHRKALRATDPAGASYDLAKLEAALVLAGYSVVDETGAKKTA